MFYRSSVERPSRVCGYGSKRLFVTAHIESTVGQATVGHDKHRRDLSLDHPGWSSTRIWVTFVPGQTSASLGNADATATFGPATLRTSGAVTTGE
jgi:hypothetical protein